MRLINKDTIQLSGKYLITDPCYVYDDQWDEFCELILQHSLESFLLFEINGTEVPVMSTRFGDGRYPVIQEGKEMGHFGVDAGLFAFIPTTEEIGQSYYGAVIELHGELTYKDGNAFVDGKLVVKTSD
jgi:hypothetical protein